MRKDLEKHPLKEDIWSTIDEYTLQMTDEEALKMASEIFRRSQHLVDDDGVLFQNVNVLRVQRSVIEQICGRLLRRLSPESLIRFFTECLPSVFATFKKGGDRGFGPTGGKPFNGTIAEMNQVICVMQVLDALYAVMPYEEIQEKVHIHASVTEDTLKDVTGVKKNPTLLFITRLSNMRRLSMTPRQKEEEAFVEVWSLLVRYAVRSYATLVCCTQSKLKILQTGNSPSHGSRLQHRRVYSHSHHLPIRVLSAVNHFLCLLSACAYLLFSTPKPGPQFSNWKPPNGSRS